MTRGWRPWLVLLAFVCVAAVTGLVTGPAGLGIQDLGRILVGGGEPRDRLILLDIRAPRVVAALLIGAALGVSGGLFQALLRNPLAEPYLLGVSSGAALGAVLALVTGMAAAGGPVLPLAALAGSLAAIGVVFRVARVAGTMDTRVLILAGVVTSAFLSACITLLLVLGPAEALRSAYFWTLGSLSGVSWSMDAVLAAYAIPASLLAFRLSRDLNALSLGEEAAAALGTDVERAKRAAYVIGSLLAAVTVAAAGIIGFVGLVVPHGVRLLWGGDHRRLLPMSFLAGGGVLAFADAAARGPWGVVEIPIGVVTALVGVPFFLVLLRRGMTQ
ncbi:MAG: FecCD family ABC transporter permease [Gemmatimonadota bacterium]